MKRYVNRSVACGMVRVTPVVGVDTEREISNALRRIRNVTDVKRWDTSRDVVSQASRGDSDSRGETVK